jgi:hypothetical protein
VHCANIVMIYKFHTTEHHFTFILITSAPRADRVYVCREADKRQLCEFIFSPAAAKADDPAIAKLLMVRARNNARASEKLVHAWHSLMWELTCAQS